MVREIYYGWIREVEVDSGNIRRAVIRLDMEQLLLIDNMTLKRRVWRMWGTWLVEKSVFALVGRVLCFGLCQYS